MFSFNGVVTSLEFDDQIDDSIDQIFDHLVSHSLQFKLSKLLFSICIVFTLNRKAIGSTINLARLGTITDSRCAWDSFPRSRSHGWDYNGENFQIFGNCLPTAAVLQVSVLV